MWPWWNHRLTSQFVFRRNSCNVVRSDVNCWTFLWLLFKSIFNPVRHQESADIDAVAVLSVCVNIRVTSICKQVLLLSLKNSRPKWILLSCCLLFIKFFERHVVTQWFMQLCSDSELQNDGRSPMNGLSDWLATRRCMARLLFGLNLVPNYSRNLMDITNLLESMKLIWP